MDAYLESLKTFDKERIHANNLEAIKPYLADANFNPDFVKGKSFAAAGLCAWAINIVEFYHVFCDVEPKRQALALANHQLAEARERLSKIKAKVKVSCGIVMVIAMVKLLSTVSPKCMDQIARMHAIL